MFCFKQKIILLFLLFACREQFGVNGGDIGREHRLIRMNGDSTQSRVARYKEERRKQLAGQFSNLARSNNGSTSSSSLDINLRKTSFKPLNSNVIKGEGNDLEVFVCTYIHSSSVSNMRVII